MTEFFKDTKVFNDWIFVENFTKLRDEDLYTAFNETNKVE